MQILRSSAAVVAVSSILALAACSPAPQTQADTRAADEAAIKKADEDWMRAAQAKQVDPWVAFYSDDAVVLPPNDKIANTKEDIRKAISALVSAPGLDIKWQLTKIEAARSGDLAYGYGTYGLTLNDAEGKPITDHGKILEIWRKQADGTWKCIVDTWNSDLPPAPPSN
jgi:ketosteroid isomerase-like protein